jgi:hypothetical protein
LGVVLNPLLQQHVTCFIEHAVKARPIAQIQTDGQASVLLLSVCCIVVGVSFFIAGLLVSRASSASITWELNASRWRPAFSSHLISIVEWQAKKAKLLRMLCSNFSVEP